MLRDFLTQGVRQTAHITILSSAFFAGALRLHAVQGATVGVAWDPSTDPSVRGYNIYYGSASRSYTNVVSAGNGTSAVISNLVNGVTYYFAATTYTSTGLESDYSAEASYAVPELNIPPTLDPLPDLALSLAATTQVVPLTGITSGSTNEVQTLSVSAFSSNPGLIPNPLVTYTSPDTTGTLTLSPAPGVVGSSIITVLVDDGGAVSNTVVRSFTVTVSSLMLQATTVGPSRSLLVEGIPGNKYQVQYCTNLGPAAVWYPLMTFTQSTVSQSITIDPTIRSIFYRAQQK